MELFDSHTHLNAEQFKGNEAEVIERAKQAGVNYMAVVGSQREMNDQAIQLAEAYPGIIAVIGWHPTDLETFTPEMEQYLQECLEHPKVKMLGEIGLDYHWDTSPRDYQAKMFRRQINIAKEHNLPISIHNRDATADVYQILKEEGIPDRGGVMHSFGEDRAWAEKFLDLGMHISFSGVVTFKKTTEVREAAQIVPDDRLLIETDAPYLAPVPKRGKQNEPAFVRYTAEQLAETRGTDLESIARITTRNAFKLFDWYPEESEYVKG